MVHIHNAAEIACSKRSWGLGWHFGATPRGARLQAAGDLRRRIQKHDRRRQHLPTEQQWNNHDRQVTGLHEPGRPYVDGRQPIEIIPCEAAIRLI